MAMKQPHTDFGDRRESGEKIPKTAQSRDTSGEKHDRVPKADRADAPRGETGEREPKSTASDMTGERKRGLVGGVGMGKADGIKGRESSHLGSHDGRTGELNTGKTEAHVYRHSKPDYK